MIAYMVHPHPVSPLDVELTLKNLTADFLIQSGLATQIHFHGKRYPWFVSDVTRKDWEWLLNSMVYGQLFPKASDVELESLRRLGTRWKVRHYLTYQEIISVNRPSNMRNQASGYTNSIRSGVQAIPSGSCTAKHLISSCIFLVQILSTSKGTSTTANSRMTVPRQLALRLMLRSAPWQIWREHPRWRA